MAIVTNFKEWCQMYETEEFVQNLKTRATSLEHDLKTVGLEKYERESGRIEGLYEALRVIDELKEEA